jgi:glyoxylase-like metal-dependent hydrolase (beta-lactamase superfamily II)
MKDNPCPDLVIHDVVWFGIRKDIVLGDKTIELHHTGLSHGLGMTLFLVPREQVAYIADLVTPNRMLFSIADFNIKEWTLTLTDVEKLDFQTAIYSHSHFKVPIGPRSEVIQTREFIQDLQSAIVTEFKKGNSLYEIPNTVRLPKYEHWDL